MMKQENKKVTLHNSKIILLRSVANCYKLSPKNGLQRPEFFHQIVKGRVRIRFAVISYESVV